jgi:site-specific DNA-methyltransferase (adenine-specific)
MILFCAFEQQFELIQEAHKYGFNHYINLVFKKNFSAQVLKANMRVVGNCEYGLIFYRDKLPKFNNNGKMIFNCMDWVKDTVTPKVHETQKPVPVLENLIRIFTDVDDVVIDCCAGSGTTLLAAKNLERKAYGFELKKQYVKDFYEKILPCYQQDLFIKQELEDKKNKQLYFGVLHA